jgi:hypothetical protein
MAGTATRARRYTATAVSRAPSKGRSRAATYDYATEGRKNLDDFVEVIPFFEHDSAIFEVAAK